MRSSDGGRGGSSSYRENVRDVAVAIVLSWVQVWECDEKAVFWALKEVK